MGENQLYQQQQSRLNTLRSLLQPGENLLWHGAAGQGLRVRSGDLSHSLSGLFILGFAIVWCLMAAQAGGFFFVFGLPFLFVGLNQTVLRFFADARRRKNTYYGITDQRVILIDPKAVDTLFYHQLSCLELEPGKNGEGCIYLSPSHVPVVRKGREVMARDTHRKGLYHIRDAMRVYGLIQQQKNAHP